MAVSARREGRPRVHALRRGARHHAFAYIPVRQCDRLAWSVSHWLCASRLAIISGVAS
jgi:hypothetical protein